MAKPLPKPQSSPTDTAQHCAAALHLGGRLKAEQHYRQVLEIAPGHFDTLHLRGVPIQQCSRSRQAALDSAARHRRLALVAGARGQSLVSERAVFPPAWCQRLGKRDRTRRQ